ncbi:MAG TPA: LacI family DNA-binding transcriptional regulator [Xanthobacteraceae bacterium]|nr:LacI family DNA-binding transcriptional regulator [Xanthobacteraceae bacterium]
MKNNNKRPRPTLRDIAREVGVHVSTISRALDPRSPHAVSPALAEKIRRASQRRGYRRNAAAYLLKTSRSRTVGVVIPDITDPVFPPIIRGIEDGLAEHDYVAILANTDGSPRRQAQVIEAMQPRGVDGLILASVERHDKAASRLAGTTPVVTISRRTDHPTFSSVVHDEEDGIRQVLTHLVSAGHRRIAAIAGPQGISTGHNRYAAFVRHSASLGLDTKRLPVSFARAFNEMEGERCVEELLAADKPFTALVCANDRLAVGAIAGLRRHGIACPKDVSVTGFNDMILADRLSPPLTTIRVHHHKAGIEAARLIVEIIENGGAEAKHIVLPVELIARGSTRSLPRTAAGMGKEQSA